MSHSSPEPIHSQYSCPDAGVVVPRVIRAAAAASRSMPTRTQPGYNPKVSVDMASAHSWAPYSVVVATLRSLSLMSLKASSSRTAAREAIVKFYRQYATPFGASRRFPAGKVYVCLDRAPFAQKMLWIQSNLIMADAAEKGDRFVSACSGYISAIGNALDELTRVDDDRGAPVLYDRAVFESAFLLAWTDSPTDESLDAI